MPKATTPSAESRQSRRHNPLAEEYAPTSPTYKQKAGKRRRLSREEDASAGYIDAKASQKILRIGQDLVDEDKSEQKSTRPDPAFTFESRFGEREDDAAKDDLAFENEEETWGDEDEVVEEVEIDPNDQDIFNRFHPTAAEDDPSNLSFDPTSQPAGDGDTTNLADLILEKIAAHEAAQAARQDPNADSRLAPAAAGAMEDEDPPLPPKVIAVYTQVGQLLSRHRSGRMPKPFKILPTLPVAQIPVILSLTNPDNWSPHAHLASVRLFISAKPYIATPYLRDILLPAVRDDIAQNKKLNVHLYAALKKSLYKPAAFFKGILFPLLEDGDCTLREAHIISSVVARVSVPVLHSAAALLRLCDIAAEHFSTSKEDGGGGSTNTFIRVLLEKKYALPYKVIDALVFHFIRFKAMKHAGVSGDIDMDGDDAKAPRLPVLWHQSFLAFAQRYRNDITEDQREALLDVISNVGHKTIGAETRRELLEGRGRGVVDDGETAASRMLVEGAGIGGDDTMVLG